MHSKSNWTQKLWPYLHSKFNWTKKLTTYDNKKYTTNSVTKQIHTHTCTHAHIGGNKTYILIFTYMNVRAIHVEHVKEMNTQVLAFIKFYNIYGIPSHIYTDNANWMQVD